MPCFIILVAIAIAGGILLSISHSKKGDAAWEEASKRLGLRYHKEGTFGARHMTGKVETFQVSVKSVRERKGNHTKTTTRYAAKWPKRLHDYRLTRSKALSGVASFFGSQDIEIGSEEFDRGVIVQSKHEADIRDFLTSNRQKYVMRVLLAYPDAKIANGKVEYKQSGLTTSSAQIEGVIRRFVALAHAMSSDRVFVPEGAPDVMADPAEFREEVEKSEWHWKRGAVDPEPVVARGEAPVHTLEPIFEPPTASAPPEPEPVAEPPELPTPVVPPVPIPVPVPRKPAKDEAPPAGAPQFARSELEEPHAFEQSTLGEPKAHDPARFANVLPRLEPRESDPEPAVEPDEDEHGPMASSDFVAASPLPTFSLGDDATDSPAVASEDVVQTRPDDASEASDLDVAHVCEDLFTGNQLGTAVSANFSEHYENRTVRWSGKLDRVDNFYSDFVFGSTPGAKAQIDVFTLGSDAYSAQIIKAVVHLSVEEGDALRAKLGETVEFEGRLVKCEPYMRTLLVADGRLC